MQLGRRQFAKALAISGTLPAVWVHAKDTALPVPTSLPQTARRAEAKGEPLVVLITQPGCVYCEMVRRNYLLPARLNDGLQACLLTGCAGRQTLQPDC